jgi:hypothetical protein
MHTLPSLMLLWLTLLVTSVGCGPGELGQACNDPGSEADCVDGAICTNEGSNDSSCREICKGQKDCRKGYTCNGVSGSTTKSCQPDDDDTGNGLFD